MSYLKALVEMVRESRQLTAEVFPLPDPGDCIDYAITEAAEYLDATLREKRNGDKRNNNKQHDARSEWGQCGYMICSAIIQLDTSHLDETNWHTFVSPDNGNNYIVMRLMCDIRSGFVKNPSSEVDVLDEWHAFTLRCGWNPVDLLAETCIAFEAKHLTAG